MTLTSTRLYHFYVPPDPLPGRLLCLVHGVASRASEQLSMLIPWASKWHVPVIAPEFHTPQFKGYQSLAGHGKPLGASRAMIAAVSEAMGRFGISAPTLDLIGFSGGAQFVHRFALLYPERVRTAVIGAAGWYTWLDEGQSFPAGTGASAKSGGLEISVRRFLSIPMRVMVGDQDVDRDANLRVTNALDLQQGRNRKERAERWTNHLLERASETGTTADVELEILPGTAHSFAEAVARGGMAERAFRFCYGPPSGARPDSPGNDFLL